MNGSGGTPCFHRQLINATVALGFSRRLERQVVWTMAVFFLCAKLYCISLVFASRIGDESSSLPQFHKIVSIFHWITTYFHPNVECRVCLHTDIDFSMQKRFYCCGDLIFIVSYWNLNRMKWYKLDLEMVSNSFSSYLPSCTIQAWIPRAQFV